MFHCVFQCVCVTFDWNIISQTAPDAVAMGTDAVVLQSVSDGDTETLSHSLRRLSAFLTFAEICKCSDLSLLV